MIKELKDFLFKGNVLDLAVAVVMGAAFNAIITSLVGDIITPLILNPVVKAANVENLSKLSWNSIAYGSLSAVINFIIVGTTLFFVVKAASKATALSKKKLRSAEAAGPSQEELLAEIRDLLANNNFICSPKSI
ncbi:MAG: large conductance mechanosensitive channel protein MscL [Streptococcus thermophilus]